MFLIVIKVMQTLLTKCMSISYKNIWWNKNSISDIMSSCEFDFIKSLIKKLKSSFNEKKLKS